MIKDLFEIFYKKFELCHRNYPSQMKIFEVRIIITSHYTESKILSKKGKWISITAEDFAL